VRLTRCAQGIVLLIVLLSSAALVLDGMALLLAAATLLAFLTCQYLVFDHRFRQAIGSVTVQRSLERTLVRKGATLHVTTMITLQVPPHLQAGVKEILPPGLEVQDGETAAVFDAAGSPQSRRLGYLVTAVVHGQVQFSGLSLFARDTFFYNSMNLTAAPFSGPLLLVQPVGLFETSLKRTSTESREVEKMSVLSGLGVRALREYYAGDDLRRIDWKLSAKHDKLFVREYTGMVSLPPLLIVDLPAKGAAFDPRDFETMVAAVAGMAEYSVRMYQHVSVLLISGANILKYVGGEKDLRRCMSMLREWMHPAGRTVNLYRTPDRTDLRSRIRTIEHLLAERADPKTTTFLASLKKNSQAVLQHQKTHVFTSQLVRTFAPLAMDEAWLYSLCEGDTSHLRQVIRQAKTMEFSVHLRVPKAFWAFSKTSGGNRLIADTLEVFA
jgi:uncharacterized protein (DUF58 family)